ncbi:hypothetical protein CJF30_00002224 [Rutstroemia sp. NJR-2017a BBW]|nr:hypothetical protein CJF30_00002224 [Rutstroemia sp. NJR-2017a BBW]
MDEPLLPPTSTTWSPISTFPDQPHHSRNTRSFSSSSTSSYSSTASTSTTRRFSHSPFPFAAPTPPSTYTSSIQISLPNHTPLSRTRSLCSKLQTEVKLRLHRSRNKSEARGKGKWVRVEGENEGERMVEMVWRRQDGGQGMIPWGGVGRSRLE